MTTQHNDQNTNLDSKLAQITTQHNDQNINLDSKLAQILKDLASSHLPIAENLRLAIDQIMQSDKYEHTMTRKHMDDIHNNLRALVVDEGRKHETQQQKIKFLDSLSFDDLNARRNDVKESAPQTFDWVFEDDATRPWDSLGDWLKNEESMYWVSGKAGAGKSTFMKFVAQKERSRTLDALRKWSKGRDCIILEFYFWLSGSKLQRSMKGCLSSLLHQMLSNHEIVLQISFESCKAAARKHSINDWSLYELEDLLHLVVEKVIPTNNICLFLDGLDEFDQDADVEHLLTFFERISGLPNVKCCLSSRPERYLEKRLSQYRKFRLQDLTAKDMSICIRTTLDDVFSNGYEGDIESDHLDDLIRLVAEKGDGVFLWVHFALRNLSRGMRNEGDVQELMKEVESLPGGMEQLYKEMWHRLQDGKQQYHLEAGLYFSFHEHFPLSLVELTIALDDNIQQEYIRDLKQQDAVKLTINCKRLENRVLTRCAGLLEVTSVTNGTERWMSPDTNVVHLFQYHKTAIKFLHRTARDFLYNTKAGRKIAGQPTTSRKQRFSALAKARISIVLQRLEPFGAWTVSRMMDGVRESEAEDEICLLKYFSQVCETLS